jgi:hypothetical protein
MEEDVFKIKFLSIPLITIDRMNFNRFTSYKGKLKLEVQPVRRWIKFLKKDIYNLMWETSVENWP